MHNKRPQDDPWDPGIAAVVGAVAAGIAVGIYHACGILTGRGLRQLTGALETDMISAAVGGAVAFGMIAVLRNRLWRRL